MNKLDKSIHNIWTQSNLKNSTTDYLNVKEINSVYKEILENKFLKPIVTGFDIDLSELNKHAFPFQKHVIQKAIKYGRYAIFADCGLGKTLIQLEWAYQISKKENKPVLILAPLAVSGQTIEQGVKFEIKIVKVNTDLPNDDLIQITNYEQLHKIDASRYVGVVLDESSILKNYTGKMKKQIIELFKHTKYKLCCTATPSPNDLNEIGNHSEFLNVMDSTDMRMRWFVREEGMSNYRLKGHAKKDFYSWIASWSTFVSNPADLGFDGTNYKLPQLLFHEVLLKTSKQDNGMLINEESVNATDFHRELKRTQHGRLHEAANIVNSSKESFILWIAQNEEEKVLLKLIPDAVAVNGSEKPDVKEKKLLGFAHGEFRVLITKLKIARFGLNYQNCSNQIFVSLDFSFENLYQGIRRSYRFGQEKDVNCYIITTDTMTNVIKSIREKEIQFMELQKEVNLVGKEIEYSLKSTYAFREHKDDDMWIMKGDSCIEIEKWEDESVDFLIFSPPFSNLFTYSDYIHDLGNNENHEEFFKQYAYLLKHLYRVLKKGRIMACHTKDIACYKESSGFSGIYNFSGEHHLAVEKAGFKYHSKICIETDPVLERARTNTQRLLYKQVTSSSCDSGVGIPEYVTLFRKWEGNKDEWIPVTNLNKKNFPLPTWQKWANPVYRKDLNEYNKSDLIKTIRKLEVDNYVQKFGCNPDLPQSWYSDIWSDIDRTDVLNNREGVETGDEKHIAPLQLEVAHRLINMYSNKNEVVGTPFFGIGSEVYEAIKNGRKGWGIELKDSYFDVGVRNCKNAQKEKTQLDLFT